MMAFGIANLKGYDCHFVDTIPKVLFCKACEFVARDPQQTECCGDIYCTLCIKELKKYTSHCQKCKKILKSHLDVRSKE